MTDQSHELLFQFLGASETGKTKRWVISIKTGGRVLDLGMVKWFGRWRRYCFFPLPDTIYDRHCLKLIADFCEAWTTKQREEKGVEHGHQGSVGPAEGNPQTA